MLGSPLNMPGFKDKLIPGVLTELTNTSFDGGVIEIYRSKRREILPSMFFWPHSADTCFVGFPSLKRFEEMKANSDIAFSKKILHAHPVQAWGYVTSQHGGRGFGRLVADGVMYAGEAAGFSGTIHSMIMGQHAAATAAAAVKDGDVSRVRLLQYQKIFERSDIRKSPFYWNYIEDFYGSYRRCLKRFQKIRE